MNKTTTKPNLKEEVLKYLKKLNEYKIIKIQDTEKERLIFKNDDTFKLFGKDTDGEGLSPFDDYSYKWLNSFLDSVIYKIDYSNPKDYNDLKHCLEEFEDEINEAVESETDVYTYDLTQWLGAHNGNVYYMSEVLEDYGTKDGFSLLQQAQYKAIEEKFFYYLSILKEDLNERFEDWGAEE